MKPTSQGKITSEAFAVYEKMIKVLLYFGPIEDLDEIIHPHFIGYGTAAHEFFKDIHGVKGMAEMQAEQLKDTNYTLTRKPVFDKILANGTTCLILEDFELHMHDNDHHLALRLSTVLEKISNKWVVAHFHGSTPDANIDEEEALPMEGLRKKNQELEAKIRERTRELEIEAALERVRTRTMAMHKTSELQDVINTVYRQFLELKVDISGGAFIAINSDIETEIVCWGAGGTAEYIQRVHLPLMDMPIYTELLEGIKKGPGFFVEFFTQEEKRQFFKELFRNPPYSESDKSRKKELLSRPGGYTRSCVVNKHTSIFIINHHGKPFSEADNEILRRMGNVFEQTYTRFLDLQKAEAQAREAQINLAVERVRAKALAMHRSEEIMEVVATLKNEVMSLEIPDVIAATIFLEAGENKVRMWDLSSLEKDNNGYEVPFDITFRLKKRDPHLYVKRVWENQEDYFFEEQDHKDFTRIIAWLREQHKGEIADEIKAFIEETQLTRLHHAVKRLNNGKLAIDLLNAPPEEMKTILTKMGAAFDLAYRRFEDLKKAEAQKRESQIQLALERIRSRAMAMHSTDELGDVLCVLFEQFDFLGIEPVLTHLTLFDEENNNFSLRITTSPKNKVLAEQILDIEAVESWKTSYENWKKGGEYTVDCIEYPPESLEAVWEIMHEVMSSLPDEYKIYPKDFPEGLFTTQGHCRYGYIGMNHRRPATEEEKAIVARFAREFGVVYQRFLELKKAEIQVREAEIELALERVRARTMAMHKSEELAETALVLYQQFAELGNIPDRMSIGIFKEETGEVSIWPTDQSGRPLNKRYSSFWANSPVMTKMYKARKAGKESMVEDLSGENLKVWLKFIREEMKLFVDDTNIKGRRVQQAAFFSDGFLLLTTNEPVSDEILQLLIRFARVFSQTYTRFLDLQKAEAQAREAQIEAALERVRAKTMAMHNTDDIAVTVTTFFNELLGLHPDSSLRCGVGILSQSEHMELWTASIRDNSETVLHSGTLDMSLHPLLNGVKNTWINHDKTFSYVLKGKDLKVYFGILNDAPDYPVKFDLDKIPETVHHNSFTFRDGVLFAFTDSPLQDDIHSVLERFASVFGQTYTRYLDLHKAEAQAREAQIEAALERIRAVSMAMHKTEDVSKVVSVFFEQLKLLELNFVQAWINVFHLEESYFDIWFSPLEGIYDEVRHFKMPSALFEDTSIKSWREGHKYSYLSFTSKQEMDALVEACDEATQSDYFSHFQKELKIKQLEFVDANFKYGTVSKSDYAKATAEEEEILYRFAKVFEQTYTRFLDLKKAEAQAREAQIEAALEKVRSQSLAMHSTDEMQQVANAVYEQLRELGVVMDAVGMSGVIEAKQDYDVWVGGAPLGKALRIPYNEDTKVQRDYNRAIEERTELFARTYSGKVKEEYINHLFTHGSFPEALEKKMKISEAFSTSIAFAKNSSIQIVRYSNEPYSHKDNEVLKRFAQVFEQAYIRFRDLEKAEAQARESQIEAALERVRARSMAMQSSEELSDVLSVLFQQFDFLGIGPKTAWLTLWNPEDNTFTYRSTGISGKRIQGQQILNIDGMDIWRALYEKWKTDSSDTVEVLFYPQEDLKQLFQLLDKTYSSMPEEERLTAEHFPNGGYSIQGHCKFGYIGYTHTREPTEEERDILTRFATEFGRVYQRFLDIEKAEAQAKEARIESGLERVRARTMGMQTSDELREVVLVINEQLQRLDFGSNACNIIILERETGDSTYWVSGFTKDIYPVSYHVPYLDHPYYEALLDPWKRGDQYVVYEYSGQEKKDFEKISFAKTGFKAVPVEAKKVMESLPYVILSTAYFTNGALQVIGPEALSEEKALILQRFSKVFDQTYTRYLDLERAEAQAREAEIQLALERIRARTMAMQESSELTEVLPVIFQQLKVLGVETVWTHLTLVHLEENAFTYRMTGRNGERIIAEEKISLDASEHWAHISDAVKSPDREPDPITRFEVPVKDLDAIWELFDGIFSKLPEGDKVFPADFPDGLYTTQAYDKFGFLGINQTRKATEEEADILLRFSKEFGRLYQRFLDLQNAENRAREAQVEAALERIRSHVTGMQESSELLDIVVTMRSEFIRLGHEAHYFWHMRWLPEAYQKAMTSGDGTRIGMVMQLPRHIHGDVPLLAKWEKSKEPTVVYAMDDEAAVDYVDKMVSLGDFQQVDPQAPSADDIRRIGGLTFVMARTSHGEIGYSLPGIVHEPPAEDIKTLVRFAGVFDLAYRRFEDLKESERQKRETEIELALERVRSKTMAMHQSQDLEEIVISLFEEVMNLGLDKSIRCGLGILEGHEGMETRSVNSSPEGTLEVRVGMLNMDIHPMLIGLKKAWNGGSSGYSYEFTTEDVRKYYTALNKEPEYPFNANLEALPDREYHQSFFFSSGILFAFSENPISEEESNILGRFAAVFGQTYRRFLDLKKAEYQAVEATKQASIERVRGQIASMRSTADLERITPLIWNELTVLEVPFIRCGVFIIHEETKAIDAYLSAPDGHALGVMKLDFDAGEVTKNTVIYWRKNKIYQPQWTAEEFTQWTESLLESGKISDRKTYQDQDRPPDMLYLNFVPFTQGMLYVGNTEPLESEALELIQSLAEAFAFAYARYEDFNRLEKAKEGIEKALGELKETQKQLVHSEKMASLGELTAGIAHEIQNPLNFVNNFSEVSVELLEEMQEEMNKGDLNEVKAIMEDIKQNLDKINQHGKRADGIVKGMLQHSRTSSGEKEPTDINVLADEYLRLAYHGLRAKDKSFNATLETHFDESLGKVKVVPQDIGRVILNLITNAFHVVKEKKEKEGNGYTPMVTVITRKKEKGVEIAVKDNGNGIPEAIREKIFQPFFTTKPTGQGTGLGLSMSYDIVTKGHGGELKVDTKIGKGTTFTIQIPTG